MEDFIQVLIYLIIIISFLSSLFKKKGKEPTGPIPQKRQPEVPDSYETSVKTEEEEGDIFREISDLFKTELPTAPETSKRRTTIEHRSENMPTGSEHTSEEYKRTESEHVSYDREKSSVEHSPTYSEHNLDVNWHQPTDWVKRKKPKIDAAVEKKADTFTKLLEQIRKSESNVYSLKIHDTLKNPQSLREYFLISEIIGRPKALKE